MKSLDWPALMRAGQEQLGLVPAQFWSLTPSELWMRLGLERGAAALDRAGLQDLLNRYPDNRKGSPTDGL